MVPFGHVEGPGISCHQTQPESLRINGLGAFLAGGAVRFRVLGHDFGGRRHCVAWQVGKVEQCRGIRGFGNEGD